MIRRINLCIFLLTALVTSRAVGATSWPLPDLTSLSGWRQEGKFETFNHDTLYEYIDGDAETFFAFGFKALGVAKYVNEAQKITLTLNLYHMESPLAAFGVYSNGRSRDARFAQVGAQGYLAENALDFWKGSYYVRVIGEGSDMVLTDALLAFGRSVSAKVEGYEGEPPEARLMPTEGRIPNTLKYQPQNVLGQSFLVNAFLAEYDLAGTIATLVVSQYPTQDEAVKAFHALMGYVKGTGTIAEQDEKSFFGTAPYYKNILAARIGSRIVCVLRAPDRPAAQRLVEAFQRHNQ